jgi:hypothetical protein
MKKNRFPIVFGCLALLAGCMESHSPIPDETQPEANPTPVGGFVLRDPDNQPVRELPVELLQDIRKQMIEKGLTDDAKYLEAAYDFNTGKLRPH